jgi:hypothetical protein
MQLKYIKIRNMCGSNPLQFHLRKTPIRGTITLSRNFHIHPHSQIPCANKSRYLTFSRLQNLIQWQCDTVNLTPPCKYFITHAKILHAKYFMQRMQNKAQQKLNKADETAK